MFPVDFTFDDRAFMAEVDTYVTRIGNGAQDPVLSPGMTQTGRVYLHNVRRRFYASQASGWPPLAASTVRSKKRRGTFLKGTLVDSEKMVKSLTPGNANSILRTQGTVIEAGTSDRKAPFHQHGTSRMPRRVVIPHLPDPQTITEMDRETVKAVNQLLAVIFTK